MRTRWPQAAALLLAVVLLGDLAWLAASLRPHWDDRRAAQRRGFVCRRHTDGSRYVVFTPHSQSSSEQLPLIVFLNGVGENGDDGVKHISNNFGSAVWELKHRFPFAVLATQCGVNGVWNPDSADTARLLEILDRTIAEYDIDRDRVYLTGPSAGGTGTWRLGAAFPDRFAAIVPLASGDCGMPEVEAIRAFTAANLPVWSFCNSGDDPALVTFNRRMHAQLVAAGIETRLTEYAAAGHDCWTDAYRTPALYDWLWRQRRTANALRPKYASLVDRSPIDEWTRSTGCEIRFSDDALQLGGGSPSSPAEIVCPAPLVEFDVRFEFRIEAASSLSVILRRATDDPAGHEILCVLQRPECGSGGFVRADRTTSIATADPIAQRALHPRDWNDVRLTLARGTAALELNGLPYCAASIADFAEDVRFGLAADSSLQVRYLRFRPAGGTGEAE